MSQTATATIWSDVLDRFRSAQPHLFRGWFYQLAAKGLEHGVLTIAPQNRHQGEYLTSSCAGALADAAQSVTGRFITVRIAEPPANEPANGNSIKQEPEADQPAPTFATFAAGPENQLAYSAVMAVAEQPGTAHNPLLIIGPNGVGKTHLLSALCSSLRDRRPTARCRYITGHRFGIDFMEAAELDRADGFRSDYSALDLLAIDDLQRVAHRDRSQEELFHVYQAIVEAGRQVVATADRPLPEIEGLAPRLASRFGSGLVACVEAPGRESRVQIVRSIAARMGVTLALPVGEAIASSCETGGEMDAALQRIVAAAASRGCEITDALARQVLHAAPQLPADAVLRVVSSRLGLSNVDLRQRRQSRAAKYAREIAMHQVRELTGMDLPTMARFFDVPTAEFLDTARRVAAEVEHDGKLAGLLDEIAREAKNAV